MGVEGQQVVGADVDVVVPSAEMLVMYGARENTMVLVAVGDGVVVKENGVFGELHVGIVQGIGGAEGLDVSGAMGNDVAGEVEFLQRTPQPQVARGRDIEVVEETGADVADKLGARLMELHIEVDVAALGRDVAFNDGRVRLDSQWVIANCVACFGIDVNLSEAGVPTGIGEEGAEAAAFQHEVIHTQLTPDVGLVEELLDVGKAGHGAAEVDRMEVDEIEDIGHVDMIERGGDGIVGTGRCDAVEPDALMVGTNIEVVDGQMLLAVSQCRGSYLKQRVADVELGAEQLQDSFGMVISRLVERYLRPQLPMEALRGGVVVEVERGLQLVVACQHVERQVGTARCRHHIAQGRFGVEFAVDGLNEGRDIAQLAVAIVQARGAELGVDGVALRTDLCRKP